MFSLESTANARYIKEWNEDSYEPLLLMHSSKQKRLSVLIWFSGLLL